MQAVYFVNALHHTGCNHFRCTARREFFCVLEQKAHLAGELAAQGADYFGGCQKDGRMSIMAARVHDPRPCGFEGDICLLVDGQRVDVGTNGNGPSGFLSAHDGHHAGGRGARVGNAVKGVQHGADPRAGLRFVKRQFRVLMKLSAPLQQLRFQRTDLRSKFMRISFHMR